MAYEVILPKLGQTVEESSIVEWVKEEGDEVARGDVLFTVETDKATLDVEATRKGYLRKILVPAGEEVPVLTVVAYITRTPDEPLDVGEKGSGGVGESGNGGEAVAEPEAAVEAASSPAPARSSTSGRIFASPRARKAAREHGVDLAEIVGSGPNGRIVEKDVLAYVAAAPKATPVARRLAESLDVDLRAVTGTGPGGKITKADVEQASRQISESANQQISETATPVPAPAPAVPVPAPAKVAAEVPMSGVRAIIAQRMHESHIVTAPVTLTMEVDATEFVALREKLKTRFAKELGFNISYNDLLIKVVTSALRKFPAVNARLDGEVIRQMREIHISLAMDTGRGLIVPVVRDTDQKGLLDIARATRDLVVRTRAGKVQPDELSGGTFTLSNLGMFDIDGFTPIINFPEAAILGVGRIKDRPAVVDGELCVRKLMWLSLTFDHRLVDGAPAARFLQYVKDLIEDPYLLLV